MTVHDCVRDATFLAVKVSLRVHSKKKEFLGKISQRGTLRHSSGMEARRENEAGSTQNNMEDNG